jgi:hypothetical protein
MMQEENRIVRSGEAHKVPMDTSWDSVVRALFKRQEEALEVWEPQNLFNGRWTNTLSWNIAVENFLVELKASRKTMDMVISIIEWQLKFSKRAIGDAVAVRNRFRSIWIPISTESSCVGEYWSVSK